MDKTIAPIEEVITSAQVGRASDRFAERCRKNASSLPKDTVQQVLEEEGDQLAQDMFEAFRNHVERRSNMIMRHVTVARSRSSPKQVIDAARRKQYIDEAVLETMPGKGEGIEEVDVYFFNLGRYVSVDELDREYESRGFTPDPYAQAQVNIDDPSFADEHPNGTQWDRKGKVASYLAFSRWYVERKVYCNRDDDDWRDYWWFAGVRKSSPPQAEK